MALLWPELDEEHARNALNQTLFALRRALADSDVVQGRSELRINVAAVDCDLVRFNEALGRGDRRQAVATYTGPFLDGFFLSDAPEFERWVDDARQRLARRAKGCLQDLAKAAEANGDHRAASELWWRIAEMDPFDSAAALALVQALAASGQRARAVHFARRHEELLRDELGAAVDPELKALVAHLLTESPIAPNVTTTAFIDNAPEPAKSPSSPQLQTISNARPRVRLRNALVPALAVMTTLVGLAIGIRNQRRDARLVRDPSVTVVAVFPFKVRGAADGTFLRNGLVELLSRGLSGAGDLRAVDPSRIIAVTESDSGLANDLERTAEIAGNLKADQFVIGDAVSTTRSMRISASVYERGQTLRLVGSASVDGRPDELLSLVDRLSTELLAAQALHGRSAATDIGALSSRSLPAVKSYLSAQAHRRAGRYAAALEAFQLAIREDSTFGLAWYGLSNVADWAGRSELVLPAARRAAALSGRLTEHDRLLAQAHLAWREARMTAAEQLYGVLVHSYPEDAESWYQLGELLFHSNSRRGRSFAEARLPFERVLALQPNDRETLMHLVRIVARSGTPRELDSLTSQAIVRASPSEAREISALRAAVLDDSVAWQDVLRELAPSDAGTLGVAAWRVGIFALDVEGAEDILRLGASHDRPPSLQMDARAPLLYVLAARGRINEALEQVAWMERMGGAAAAQGLRLEAVLSLLPVHQPSEVRLSALQARLDSSAHALFARKTGPDSALGHDAACLNALIAARRGQQAAASSIASFLGAARLEPVAQEGVRVCAASVRARLAVQAGRADEALNELLAHRSDRVPEGLTEFLDRFLIAELLLGQGREREAESWYASMAQHGLDELAVLALADRRLGEIAERRGDRAMATEYYRRFLHLRKDSDPEFQKDVAAVRARLAAMGKYVLDGGLVSR